MKLNLPSKIILFLTPVIVLLTYFLLLPSIFIEERIANYYSTGENLITLNPGIFISDTFYPNHENINSLSLLLKNPAIQNKQSFVLDIKNDQEILRSLNFSGTNVGDPNWLKFKFFPIKNSTNFPLTFNLYTSDSPSSVPISVYSDATKNKILFSTTYTSLNFTDSLKEVIRIQQQRLKSYNPIYLSLYFIFIYLLIFFIII